MQPRYMKTKEITGYWRTLLVASGLTLAVVVWVTVNPLSIFQKVATLSGVPLLVLLLILYLVRPVLSLPGSFIVIFIGFKFDVVTGFPIAVIGSIITAIPIFLFARFSVRTWSIVERIAASAQEFANEVDDFRGVFGAVLLPLPADPVSYSAGIADVPFLTFISAKAIAEIPYLVLYLSVGDSMQQLTFQSIGLQPIVLVLGAIGLLVLLSQPLLYRLIDRPE